MNEKTDTRIVYGVRCTWWDSIYEVRRSADGPGIPTCPHCFNVLYEVQDEAEWWNIIRSWAERERIKDGEEMIKWGRGKCYPHIHKLRQEFHYARGRAQQQDRQGI